MFTEPTMIITLVQRLMLSALTIAWPPTPHSTVHSTPWSFLDHAVLEYVSVQGVIFVADGVSSTAPVSSPQALLQHLQTLAHVPAMQDKLQVLSDALPAAPQAQLGSLIDGSNWEGDADSRIWQYDCEVLATHAWC